MSSSNEAPVTAPPTSDVNVFENEPEDVIDIVEFESVETVRPVVHEKKKTLQNTKQNSLGSFLQALFRMFKRLFQYPIQLRPVNFYRPHDHTPTGLDILEVIYEQNQKFPLIFLFQGLDPSQTWILMILTQKFYKLK